MWYVTQVISLNKLTKNSQQPTGGFGEKCAKYDFLNNNLNLTVPVTIFIRSRDLKICLIFAPLLMVDASRTTSENIRSVECFLCHVIYISFDRKSDQLKLRWHKKHSTERIFIAIFVNFGICKRNFNNVYNV